MASTSGGAMSEPSDTGRRLGATEGTSGALGVPVKLAGTVLTLARKVGAGTAAHAVAVGKEVVTGARQGRSPSELAGMVAHGWARGMRRILAGDDVQQELGELGDQLSSLLHPDDEPGAGGDATRSELTDHELHACSVEEVRRELRRRGRELLHRSAALDDPEEHPALAVILRELSPDEARIIRFLATDGPQALVDVIAHSPMTRKQRELVHHFTLVGREAGCIRPERVAVYLDNLVRLGLVHVQPFRLRGQEHYDLLYAQPELTRIVKPAGKLVRLKVVHKGVELSEFGKEMYRQCLDEHDPGHDGDRE
ncbi:Abi-alpha family protein [Haloechinothrix sp. LS1_15]|uniref:Abi-alpha family protein n=1 Tax=Haloechinothrix sp. LS1_15 TaxID=2652248 RepID=UPI0029443A49|nr:Abi-alpha family protein [Haloechinothrix sp. LS1_15]MDV6013746.1 DUF4393 domain-containing protein [Haloechinothrix sp. LS1_15]